VGYLDLVPEVDCGMHGHQGWQDRLDKEKANEMQSFMRSVTDDGKNIVVQVAAAPRDSRRSSLLERRQERRQSSGLCRFVGFETEMFDSNNDFVG
jgi:hypothetical protein